MSLDLVTPPSDAGPVTFAPANHLLGVVQRVIASRADVRVALAGNGEIVIRTERNEYYATLQDRAEFCTTPANHFQVTDISDAALSASLGPAKNLNELLWCAAFHASQGRLIEGCSKYDVVQFRHWPNLTRLPSSPNAARICALLTRHPTTIMLVHHILGIEKEEVYQIYSAAYCAGMVQRIGSNPQPSMDALAPEVQTEPARERGLFRSLFAKISGL